MPSQSNIQAVYNIERAVELAFKQLFEAASIKAFAGSLMIPSTGDAAADAELTANGYNLIDFQIDRPRVEIFATLGAGKFRFIPHPEFTGVECETAWDVNVSLFIVTAPDMMIHTALRTHARYIIHAARGSINSLPPLTRHYLATIQDNGTSPVERPEEGDFQTRINFSGMVSVQNDAWQLLTT